MITLKELKAAYPAKKIIFKRTGTFYPGDEVKLPGGKTIRLDTTLHMTFLKEEVATDHFNMMILNKIGESPLFKDDAIKTIVIANARIEADSKLRGFLAVHEGEKSTTYTFLAGGM